MHTRVFFSHVFVYVCVWFTHMWLSVEDKCSRTKIDHFEVEVEGRCLRLVSNARRMFEAAGLETNTTSLTSLVPINNTKFVPLEKFEQLQVGPGKLCSFWINVHGKEGWLFGVSLWFQSDLYMGYL